MKLKAWLCAMAITLAGCSTVPQVAPAPAYELPAGSKVGVLVSAAPEVVHEHIGTTIFNNFSKKRALSYNPEQRARSHLDAALRSAGLVVVDLGEAGFKPEQIDALALSHAQAWVENPVQAAELERLRRDLGLRAVVVVRERSVSLGQECYGGPCTDRSISSSGLYTRGVFNLTNYSRPGFSSCRPRRN